MFCNTVFYNQGIGIVIASIFVILDWMAYLTERTQLLWVSPLSWINIDNMAYARDVSAPSITYGIVFLVIADILLMIGNYILVGKKDMMIVVDEN